MASVLNRTTFEFRTFANTPDFPVAQWVHKPDMSGWTGVLDIWKVLDGDVPREATPAEKQDKIADYIGLKLTQLGADVTTFLSSRYDDIDHARLIDYRLDARERNLANRLALINAAFDWRDSVMAEYMAKAGALQAATDIAGVDAATWNFQTFVATDPLVTVPGILGVTD